MKGDGFMKLSKIITCILTALMLICAMALPAFAEGEPQYNEHDVAKLRAFFEQESPGGVKNGDVLFENYDPDDPSTWDEWEIYCGEDVPRVGWDENGRVTVLCLGREEEQLYGKLDISGMDELTFLECGMSKLTEVDCSGCAKLETIELSQNEIESINLTGCTAIELLNVASNKLKALDFSDCRGSLVQLWVNHNEIEGELDLAGMTNIEKVFVNNNKLTRVSVPAECGKLEKLICAVNDITEAEVFAEVKHIALGTALTKLHFVTRGNEVDIVSDGHGTFSCEYVRDAKNAQTGETYDRFDVTGIPDEGYEYMGLYMDGELAFEPNEAYEGEALPTMSLTAVFSGSEPEPSEPAEPSEPTPSEPAPIDPPKPPQTGAESMVSLGYLLVLAGIGMVITISKKKMAAD